MDLDLTFAAGKMSGDGNDDVGRFTIRGQYNAQTLECSWLKTYVGAHNVAYRGFREGRGIWGTWEIEPRFRGGFHIWPKRAGEGETEAEAVEQPVPAVAVAGEVELRRLVVKGKSEANTPQALECADLSALSAGDKSLSTTNTPVSRARAHTREADTQAIPRTAGRGSARLTSRPGKMR